jgi:hypothetical protein
MKTMLNTFLFYSSGNIFLESLFYLKLFFETSNNLESDTRFHKENNVDYQPNWIRILYSFSGLNNQVH